MKGRSKDRGEKKQDSNLRRGRATALWRRAEANELCLSQLSPAQPRANLTGIQNPRSCTCRVTWGSSYSTASQTAAGSRGHHQRPDSSGWDTLSIAFLDPGNQYRFREKRKWERFPDSSDLVNPAPLSDPNSEPSFSSACIPRDYTGYEHQSHECKTFLDPICFATGISRLINNTSQQGGSS